MGFFWRRIPSAPKAAAIQASLTVDLAAAQAALTDAQTTAAEAHEALTAANALKAAQTRLATVPHWLALPRQASRGPESGQLS